MTHSTSSGQAGILLLGRDEVIESRARRHHVTLELGDKPALPFEKTLITKPGTPVPWALLTAAWGLLDVWDAAVPLWEYTKTAVSVGTPDEREITRMIIGDLRVLLHAVELLFVRRNEAGVALIERFKAETGDWRLEIGDWRLAFLRAFYMVKPRLCVLPTSWISGGRQMPVTALPARSAGAGVPMVKVDLGNGRFVKCHAGDERKVRLMFSADRRHSDMAIVSRKSFAVENQKTRANKGPLVRVELQPGQFVKMYEADAIEAGYIQPKPKPGEKARPPEENKARPPAGDKKKPVDTAKSDEAAAAVPSASSGQALPDETAVAEPDDFAKYIPGVGLATARVLNSHGIMTFAQLRAAEDLSFLAQKQQDDIKAWVDNG